MERAKPIHVIASRLGSVYERMRKILGLTVADSSYDEIVTQSIAWARSSESRSLFFANVHVVMEAFDDTNLQESLNRADYVSPDGVPLVWALKALGDKSATRVYGPDATLAILEAAEREGVPVGIYGGSPVVLERFAQRVRSMYPRLSVPYEYSPPFRELTAEEDEDVVRSIAQSGARILLVGLGCPKQERWIMSHQGRVPAVMYGVGAAFDFHAGTKPQAPRWMMRIGMEWLFRFACEPKRLAWRYLRHNPRFMFLFLWQLATSR